MNTYSNATPDYRPMCRVCQRRVESVKYQAGTLLQDTYVRWSKCHGKVEIVRLNAYEFEMFGELSPNIYFAFQVGPTR